MGEGGLQKHSIYTQMKHGFPWWSTQVIHECSMGVLHRLFGFYSPILWIIPILYAGFRSLYSFLLSAPVCPAVGFYHWVQWDAGMWGYSVIYGHTGGFWGSV